MYFRIAVVAFSVVATGFAGMTALYGLVPATGAPFAGGLASQPNDFTVGLNYTGWVCWRPRCDDAAAV